MPIVELNCDTLGDLNGGLAREVINQAIQAAVSDLQDRGEEDEKPRKVVIELEMAQVKGMTVTQIRAQTKMPPYQTGGTAGEIRTSQGRIGLAFRTTNPDRIDQPTFDDIEDEE